MANFGNFTVQIEEESPNFLGDKFEFAVEDMNNTLRAVSANLSQKWVAIAREEAPKETGQFSSAIGAQLVDNEDEIGFDAFRNGQLGNFINFGTAAHSIDPKSKDGVLTFYWENGPKGPGVYHFQHVDHPGTRPNPYYFRALDRFNDELKESVKMITDRFMISFTGAGSFQA